MKRLLGILVIVCAFALASPAQSGGGTYETGGVQPSPSPTPCPPEEVCEDGGGTNSVTTPDGEFGAMIVDGALLIWNLL